jgi:twitching motility protein PilT
MAMNFDKLLRFSVQNGASDLHLQAGSVPMVRISGDTRFLDSPELTREELEEFVASIAPSVNGDNLHESITDGLDFGYMIDDVARFRCNVYSQLGAIGMVMRVIDLNLPNLEALNLPAVLEDVALSRRGLTLMTGVTGSGKSSTLAAMMDIINANCRVKVITIEDPVEFIHPNKKAMISQLELGIDTPSFDQALRQALRQDPDVILVGELRDVETLRMALRAADTGHQVFSTVHSADAPQTIERIIAMFPPEEHDLLLAQLAHSLEAIISQRLLVTRDGKRRPAVEILRGTSVTEKFIMENRLTDVREYMEGGEAGMQTFDQHLLRMHSEEMISGTEALRWASRPESLSLALRGFQAVGSGRKE